jgi:hypothetical protein
MKAFAKSIRKWGLQSKGIRIKEVNIFLAGHKTKLNFYGRN